MMQGSGMSMMWLGWVIPVLLVVAVAWLVGRFRTSRPAPKPSPPPPGDARAALELRLVNAEIDEAEFRARLNTLNERPS